MSLGFMKRRSRFSKDERYICKIYITGFESQLDLIVPSEKFKAGLEVD